MSSNSSRSGKPLQTPGREPVPPEGNWHGSAHAARPQHEAPAVHLTERELEVLNLLCQGLPNKLIGRRLNIAPGTVKTHVGNILRELGVSSRLQAVVVARQWGLVQGSTATGHARHAGHPHRTHR